MCSTNLNYKTLSNEDRGIRCNEEELSENDESPNASGVMIHIVPETNKARWNHIEDLDSFFTRMYNYHQRHGFLVILLEELFQLAEFAFVVWLFTFIIHCVKYNFLFGNVIPKDSLDKNNTKVGLNDVILPVGQCVDRFGATTIFLLTLSFLYLIFRFLRLLYTISQYADIKKFYNCALRINDTDLDNITWHDIQKKIREVQTEQHMCIDKDNLSELDIYHRILRFKNYLVALMNKNLLPVKFELPIIGECVTLSRGLLFNIEIILFKGPGSPFQNNWQLRDEYAIRGNQVELAQRLSKLILCVALINLLLTPIIFVWQFIYVAFYYVNILRKEPSALGLRTWSNYGRLYLRHFNELDHELDGRLNRAYESADKYLSSFSSPLMTVIAKNVLFISGGLLVVILALGIYDEFVFQVEHVLSIITALSAIGLICRSLIPDENQIWCPEQLMTAVLAHTQYLPIEWKSKAHTSDVKKQFEKFFQFRAGYLINEILSPILTPFLLIFVFRPMSLEIVKFFRSFTVTVRGVGNVCSFAQMDVRKHGNPDWQVESNDRQNVTENEEIRKNILDNGKIELSLIRFSLTNPEWQMPVDAKMYVHNMRQNALQEFRNVVTDGDHVSSSALQRSLISFGNIGDQFSSLNSSGKNFYVPFISNPEVSVHPSASNDMKSQGSEFKEMLQKNLADHSSNNYSNYLSHNIRKTTFGNLRKMRLAKVEGRPEGPSEALIYSLYGIEPTLLSNPINITVADMCLSTLYLHELYKQKKNSNQGNQGSTVPAPSTNNSIIVSSAVEENTPLLKSFRS